MELQVLFLQVSEKKAFGQDLEFIFLVNKVSFNKQTSESEQANIFDSHSCEDEKVRNIWKMYLASRR